MKTFNQMVEERVKQKLDDAVEKAANERIAEMLRDKPPALAPAGNEVVRWMTNRRIKNPKNTVIRLGDDRKYAPGFSSHRKVIYDSAIKALSTGQSRRDHVAKFTCQETGASISEASTVVGEAINAGAFLVVGRDVNGRFVPS